MPARGVSMWPRASGAATQNVQHESLDGLRYEMLRNLSLKPGLYSQLLPTTYLQSITRKAMKKHSPEILTGIGIAGMITTTVMAVKATPKALILLEEKKDD